jgi:hypothetical protein
MDFSKISKLTSFFDLIDTDITVTFVLDGKQYEVDRFKIDFSQGVDFKGQPQNETRGGQMYLTMSQGADYNLYDWAKRENKKKNGEIRFKTKSSGTVLEISFENAQCIKLTRQINFSSGTQTSIVITPQTIRLNGFTHTNSWRED